MILYRIGLFAYQLLLRLAAPFHRKAKKFLDGRKNVIATLRSAQAEDPRPAIWIHCASLGEFEQGRPLIEALHEAYPKYRIVLTFFSPSGYEVRKDYPLAELVSYLPMDSSKHAREFVAAVQPRLAIFVKYEFWYFYLRELQGRGIPVLSVAAIFRKQQFYFRWYGGFGRQTLRLITHFFVQDTASSERLQGIGIRAVSVTGDTRLDRVARIRESPQSLPEIADFLGNDPALVVGSAWPTDVNVLKESLNWLIRQDWKIIIAPHEIDGATLQNIEGLLPAASTRFSSKTEREAPILIVDTIGILAHIYAYGTLAYVGGAFGKGLHNTMEAAVHGLPVLFGNRNYQKFREACELITTGGGFALADRRQALQQIQELVTDARKRQQAGQQAADYVLRNRGATDRILDFCHRWLAT